MMNKSVKRAEETPGKGGTRMMKNDGGAPIPLYFQLINQMRRNMLGKLAPGDPIPSERELCERFGVSRITVRQALEQLTVNGEIYKLHGKGTFKSYNRIDGIRELVYVICSTSMIVSPGREKVIRALAETAERRGYHLVIRGYHSSGGMASLRDFATRGVDGGLLFSVQELTHADILSLRQTRIPCVFLNQPEGYSVTADYVAAGALAAQWADREHFRRIALFLPSRKLRDIRDYLSGFQAAWRSGTPPVIRETGYCRRTAAETAKALLSGGTPLPEAFICGDDQDAAGAADALTELGLRCRIPVCGVNDSYLASEMRFSSIDLKLEERSRLAADLLADILEGKAPASPHAIKIQPSFTERKFK